MEAPPACDTSYYSLGGKPRRQTFVAFCINHIASLLTPDFAGNANTDTSSHSKLIQENSRRHNATQDGGDARLESDGSILYPKDVRACLESDGSIFHPKGVPACVVTLVATGLGSGVLVLPFAFSLVGIALGALMLTTVACLGFLTLTILMMASSYSEQPTFASLLASATGSSSASILLDGCIVVYGCSAMFALLLFEGDFVPAILASIFGRPALGRTKSILTVAAFAWPCVLPRQVGVLRYLAALSPVAIIILDACVVLHAHEHFEQTPASSEVTVWEVQWDHLLQAASIFIFSMMCHTQAVPVAHLLESPSVFRIVNVAASTNLCFLLLYLAVGVGGYLSFLGTVQGDFLLNYDRSLLWTGCRFMLAIVCFVGIPMNSGPCVQAARNLLAAVAAGGNPRQAEESCLKHAALASVLLAIVTALAVNLDDVAAFVGIVGGSLTTLQMFWLPALIYWKILYPMHSRVVRVVVMTGTVLAGTTGFTSLFANLLG